MRISIFFVCVCFWNNTVHVMLRCTFVVAGFFMFVESLFMFSCVLVCLYLFIVPSHVPHTVYLNTRLRYCLTTLLNRWAGTHLLTLSSQLDDLFSWIFPWLIPSHSVTCYLNLDFPFYLISFVMFLVFLTHCIVLLSFLHEVLLYSTERGIEQNTAHSITFTLASFLFSVLQGAIT